MIDVGAGAGVGSDTLYGGQGDDTIGDGAGTGNDLVYGNFGNDLLVGNSGIGGSGNETMFGGQGDDFIIGSLGASLMYGNLGNDSMVGGPGADTVFGGQGNDAISGSGGDDIVYGNFGDDFLLGSPGNNTLYGGQGDDVVFENGGNTGKDLMWGNLGADTFDFTSTNPSGGTTADTDHIADFSDAQHDIVRVTNPPGGVVYAEVQGDNTVVSVETAIAYANTHNRPVLRYQPDPTSFTPPTLFSLRE